ncbi:MAG: hypothetical protein JWR05_1421 [Mucilaginibacter sp.]|nr:hypothetical protein [Mucilaginibacter sp.]
MLPEIICLKHLSSQSKILNKQYKYANVFHKIGDDYPVDLLWDYALRYRGFRRQMIVFLDAHLR